MYKSFQFPVEMNTRGNKTHFLHILLPFTQNMFYGDRASNMKALFSHCSLHNIMLWLQNYFNLLRDLKTATLNVSVTYPASYGFSNAIGLSSRSRDTALLLWDYGSTKQLKFSFKEVKIAQLRQWMCFISRLLLLTVSGRCRVEFGVFTTW